MQFYEDNVVLNGDKIYLRQLNKDDKEAIFNIIYHNKEVLRYYLSTYKEDINDFDFDNYLNSYKKNSMYCLGIILKESDELIGVIHQVTCLTIFNKTIELGYALHPDYWNKGYCSEALELMLSFLFEKGVHKIKCAAITENKASIKVMQKCSMKYEYTDIEAIYYHDRYYDLDYYYIFKDMFHVKQQKGYR